jgi:D-methionine transport system substrate-binding protein
MRIFIYPLLLILGLTSCSKPAPNSLKVGTIAGPETELVIAAKTIALEKYGLNIQVVEFSDYNLPNVALEDGSLDANVYQHKAYLEAAMKAHHYDLEIIGKTFVYPMGIYTKKVKTLSELPENALIAIPNDPSNEARALLLLEKAGFITLKTSTGSLKDIATNPKNFHFKELDAAQLPRVLSDVDAALINTTFALPAGLSPSKDALFLEDKRSPYANLIVIKNNSLKKPQLLLFAQAMQSDAVKDKAKALFGDAALPAW